MNNKIHGYMYITICIAVVLTLSAFTLQILDGVTSIGDKEYARKGLRSIIIPNSVMDIGGGAFEKNELKSVVMSARLYKELKETKRLANMFNKNLMSIRFTDHVGNPLK